MNVNVTGASTAPTGASSGKEAMMTMVIIKPQAARGCLEQRLFVIEVLQALNAAAISLSDLPLAVLDKAQPWRVQRQGS